MKQLTKEQALQRLENPENLFNIIHKNDFSNPERYKNNNENGRGGKFSQVDRDIAINLSKELGTHTAAEIVGCRPETLSQWKSGITSNGNKNNIESSRPDQKLIESNREKASELAAERMLKSLDLITDSKLTVCNAMELSTIASKLQPLTLKNGGVNGAGGKVNVNIYVPKSREERDFESVDIAAEVVA